MFLSKVVLQKTAPAKQALMQYLVKGAYGTHQLVWQLFPDQKQRSFLFREERCDEGFPFFYVLSPFKPQPVARIFSIQTKVFEPQLSSGQRLAYTLRVNPTIAIKSDQGRGKVHDVMMHAKYLAKKEGQTSSEKIKFLMQQAAQSWLLNERRQSEWGVRFEALPDVESCINHRSQKNSKQTISFSAVDFQGTLVVNDPLLFLQKLSAGFGRAKSMGCGLMMIRRV